MGKIKLAVNFEFETEEQFGELCEFLADHGYDGALKALGEQLLEEAERRNFPISSVMIELQKQVQGNREGNDETREK